MGNDSVLHPILVSIPHASDHIPEEVLENVAITQQDLKGYTDLYTERIFAVEGVYIVQCDLSRVIVDVNRAPDDISKELTFPRSTRWRQKE